MGLAVLAHDESDADGEDGHIFRVADLLHDLVESELAECVDSGRHQDDVLLPFHAIQAVERVIEGVEQIGFGKSRDA